MKASAYIEVWVHERDWPEDSTYLLRTVIIPECDEEYRLAALKKTWKRLLKEYSADSIDVYAYSLYDGQYYDASYIWCMQYAEGLEDAGIIPFA